MAWWRQQCGQFGPIIAPIYLPLRPSAHCQLRPYLNRRAFGVNRRSQLHTSFLHRNFSHCKDAFNFVLYFRLVFSSCVFVLSYFRLGVFSSCHIFVLYFRLIIQYIRLSPLSAESRSWGHEAKLRPHTDRRANMILIPEPAQGAISDGVITGWHLFAKLISPDHALYLQVNNPAIIYDFMIYPTLSPWLWKRK